jgi:hypothetical protein
VVRSVRITQPPLTLPRDDKFIREISGEDSESTRAGPLADTIALAAGGRFADDVCRQTAHLLIPRRPLTPGSSDQWQCSSRSPQSCHVFS